MEDVGRAVRARYQVGKASQQAPLQADVELGEVGAERLALESRRDVLAIQVNTLLHRSHEFAVPPPPKQAGAPAKVAETVAQLVAEAETKRPELSALRSRIDGGRAGVERAEKEYYPDVSVMASYNSMWSMVAHQLMVGLTFNLPVWTSGRRGGVDEATAQVSRMEAERARLLADIESEVAQALRRLHEVEQTARLLQDELLPPARDRVNAARIGFETNQNSFADLIEAAHALRKLELRYEETTAAVWTRQAELTLALGRFSVDESEGGER
jgi:outer membrane protein TolC